MPDEHNPSLTPEQLEAEAERWSVKDADSLSLTPEQRHRRLVERARFPVPAQRRQLEQRLSALQRESQQVDHFADDRAKLMRAADALGDLAVELSEWVADHVFGDPGLQPAMREAGVAADAARAAYRLASLAVDVLPPEPKAEPADDDAHLRELETPEDRGLGISSRLQGPGPF